MEPIRVRFSLSRSLSLVLLLVASVLSAACGGANPPEPIEPFDAFFPDEGPDTPRPPPAPLPPPEFTAPPRWDPDAFAFGRTATFGSFPSDMDLFGATLFVSDADAVEGDGATIVPLDVTGSAPVPSLAYAPATVHAGDLVDSLGAPASASSPIGFGFYLNDVRVVSTRLGFVLANAAGSDTVPCLSNLVVFDPQSGSIRQVVNLATTYSDGTTLLDSSGAAVPGNAFTQAGAEGVEYVPLASGKGLLYVAMSNFVFGAPSYGAVKYPGTVQVFDVDPAASQPIAARPVGTLATTTIRTRDYNPVAVSRFTPAFGPERILVTVAGTTGYDSSFRLVPVTPSSVEAYDAESLALLGRFELGLAGLSGIRPALGRDGAGHAVGFFASSVRGEVYLLRLDGLDFDPILPAWVSVLRGPNNGIPIDPSSSGGPGGNVAGLALSSDGRTLLASGFGDLFAFGGPTPGRLFALSLPADLVAQSGFGRDFVPGTANLVTQPGRTLGPVVIAATTSSSPEVYVSVSGSIDTSTFLGSSPASVGTLSTWGKIR